MKLKRLASLVIAGTCLLSYTLPTDGYATVKYHWAVPTLEKLQSQDLFTFIMKDAEYLEEKMEIQDFESLLNIIWESEFGTSIVDMTPGSSSNIRYIIREDAAEMIYKAINPNGDGDEIEWIKSAKIMSGYPSGEFKPADRVTRGQGVVIMSNLKNYLKTHPELKMNPKGSEAALHPKDNQLTYTAAANAKGTVDFTLSWGEKKTGGYSVKITKVAQSGKELRITYKLTSPGPNDIVTQALTYPKDTVKLELGMEAYKQLTIILVEDKTDSNLK